MVRWDTIEEKQPRTSFWDKVHGLPPLKKIWPLLVISAIAPLLVTLLASGDKLFSFSQGKKSEELRIWFEPAETMARPFAEMTIRMLAEFDSETGNAAPLTARIAADAALSLSATEITYAQPFRGRTVVATISVVPSSYGTFTLSVPPETVVSGAQNSRVITSPATIKVLRTNE